MWKREGDSLFPCGKRWKKGVKNIWNYLNGLEEGAEEGQKMNTKGRTATEQCVYMRKKRKEIKK